MMVNTSYFLSAGNGGNAGIQKVFVNTVEGNVELRSCGGNGAPPARNGAGGNGKRLKGVKPNKSKIFNIVLPTKNPRDIASLKMAACEVSRKIDNFFFTKVVYRDLGYHALASGTASNVLYLRLEGPGLISIL